MPGAGELNQKIQIQRLVYTDNDIGGSVQKWLPRCSVWAKITPTASSENALSMGVNSKTTYEILIFNRSDIEPSDRIQWGDRAMNIVDPQFMGMQEMFLKIIVESGVGS